MKVFMDMASSYKDLKVIAIGATGTAREVVQYDPEMRNRVAEIYVPLMTDEELTEIIEKGQRLLNFGIPKKDQGAIVKYSNGLASVCHQLCLNICFASGIVETLDQSKSVSSSDLESALKRYVDDASDSLKATFDKAVRQIRVRSFDNCRIILKALANAAPDGLTRADLLAEIRKTTRRYPPGNLTLYLNKLIKDDRGAILRYDSISGVYSFSDPLYQVFAKVVFAKDRPEQVSHTFVFDALVDILKVDLLETFYVTTLYKPLVTKPDED